MIVSQTYKFIYIAPPKTGSTSMDCYLKDYYEADQWKKCFVSCNKSDDSCWRHIPDIPSEFSDYFIFATVRNPYHLVLSLYMNDIKTNPKEYSFEEFVIDRIPKKRFLLTKYTCQHDDYKPPQGCIFYKLNQVVKLENMQKDVENLPFYKEGTFLQTLNESTSRKPNYTKELAKIVYESHKEDFYMFGYNENSWKSNFLL
jgi:hypothetical protein